jgi:hypothetical protein
VEDRAQRARGVGPVLAASLLLVAPGTARAAAPSDATIQWSAPPECPGEPAVHAAIERLIARPFGRSGEAVRVDGEVTRDPRGRYQLRLAITPRAGLPKERRLDGETCAQVTDAAAVVIALAVDAQPPPEPALPAIETAPRPQQAKPAASMVRAASPASIRPAWEIAALGGVDFASLPGPAAGVGIDAAIELGAHRAELRAMAWLPRRATLADRSSVGGDFSLYAAGLRYCRWLVRRSFDIAPCGGLEAGALVASGVGVASPASGVGRWLAPQIGLLGMVRPTSRFAVSLAVDGLALVFRDWFAISSAGGVYRPPAATLRAVLAAHLRFP